MTSSLLSGRISTLRDETGAVSITMLMYVSKLDKKMLVMFDPYTLRRQGNYSFNNY